jgi:lysophospholipase L1-like esterase
VARKLNLLRAEGLIGSTKTLRLAYNARAFCVPADRIDTERSMRRFLLLLFAALLAAPALAQASPAAAALAPQAGDIYLALGDSLATGYETAGNADGQPGYPAFLHAQLAAAGLALDYANLGVSGETSTSLVAAGGQLAQAEAFLAQAQAEGRRVGLITLSVGANDVITTLPGYFPGGQNIPAEQMLASFRTNFAQTLDRLRAASPEATILVMDYYNPYPGLVLPGESEARGDTLAPQLNATIAEIAGARGIPVAAVYESFVGDEAELLYVRRPYYQPSSPFDPALVTNYDFHPRPAGHLAIADAFAAGRFPLAQARVALLLAQRA